MAFRKGKVPQSYGEAWAALAPRIQDGRLTTQALVEELGMTKQSLSRWIRKGTLRPTKVGTANLYDPDNVSEWLQACYRGPGGKLAPIPTTSSKKWKPDRPKTYREVLARIAARKHRDEEWFTALDLSFILGISHQTVSALVQRGKLVASRGPKHRQILVSRQDAMEYIKRRYRHEPAE